jgi:hypothetical protein
VWTLLPYEADWRWMIDRDDSPWYPTMRLFRQTTPGSWDAPLAAVGHRLRCAAASRAAGVAEPGLSARSPHALS